MARVVGRSRVKEGVGTQTKLSETAVFIALGIAILAGVRWYFFVHLTSPGYALGEYVAALKSGDIDKQYALIDADDKQYDYPTQKDYEKAKQARGYTERISNVSTAPPIPDVKDPDTVTIELTMQLRAASAGKELYQTGTSQSVTDKYTMHKDKDGHWKVWLHKSPMKNLLQITPNPPSDSF